MTPPETHLADALEVVETGPLATVQDTGRVGMAHLGIGRSGACDLASHALANRLVGNPAEAATLEVTFGGLVLIAHREVTIASAGARCQGAPHLAPIHLSVGEQFGLGSPVSGARTYVAVRGGIDVPPILGSRSSDLLSGLGPVPVSAGDRLSIGHSDHPMPGVDLAPVAEPPAGLVTVNIEPGPRRDWFTDDAWESMQAQRYLVSSDSNRIGARLDGEPLERSRNEELSSEGMVRGALQVPPGGTLVLFLSDHPVTGGYPVIGYVVDTDVDRCAQLQPGQELRLKSRR